MLRSLVAGLVSFTVGCSSAYIPQPGPRVSVVIESGSVAYVRDGKNYEGGLFGGDIEEAVQGNARAEQYARDYKSGMATGFALSMLGIGTMVGGGVVGVMGAERTNSNSTLPVVGLGMVGAGLILDLVGSLMMVSAVPHLYDAVNAYNDGLGSAAAGPPGR